MPAQAEPETGVVGDQVLALGEGEEIGLRLHDMPHGERRRALDARHVPVGLPAVASQARERAGGGEAFEVARVDAAACEVLDTLDRALRACRGEAGHAFEREPLHLAQAEAQGGLKALLLSLAVSPALSAGPLLGGGRGGVPAEKGVVRACSPIRSPARRPAALPRRDGARPARSGRGHRSPSAGCSAARRRTPPVHDT